MVPDLPRRIRRLTQTKALTPDEIVQRRAATRRPWPVVAGAAISAGALVGVLLFVFAHNGGGSSQRVYVGGGPTPTPAGCRLVDTTIPTSPGVPVIRSSTIVFAPAASHLPGNQEVTVGLNTTNDGVALSIQRSTGSHPNYKVTQYEGDNAIGGSTATAFKTMRAGDPVEIEIAIRNTNPTIGGRGPGALDLSSIAYRLVDLRTHQSVHSGQGSLIRGAPAPPTALASATHSDVTITETTWGAGWDAVSVGLGNETIHQPPTADDALIGITHKATTTFVVVDAAHPHGLAVQIAALHAQAGDKVTLQAQTTPSGTHTAVTIADKRTLACVTSPG